MLVIAPAATYWRHRKDATFISPYAATVPDDDFAESFAYYILEPERLQKECPSKYAFMHVEVFTEYRHDEAAGGSQGEVRRAEQEFSATVGRLSHPHRFRLGRSHLSQQMLAEIDAQRTRAVDGRKSVGRRTSEADLADGGG